MKKKQVWKVISLLLSVILLFSSVPISAISLEISDAITNELETPSAVSESGGESVTVTETPKTIDLHAGEKGIFELQAMQVDLAALPEVIDQAVALEKGHVNRLTAQEDSFSTVIYQNSDGTKSTYLFSTPVKYVDESGVVRDKSSKVTAITDTLYSHAMLNNSTKVYFPKNAANGTKVSFGDYSITMSPKTSVQSAATQQSDRNLMYANVFGKGTILSYSTEMNGLKEDIILALNVGISSFDFVLVATNVTPVQIDGVWCFQNADGAVVAKLGSIDVRDSAGNTMTGTLTLTPTEVAGKYDVTVSVDESFLNASTTTYPVYIDPTIYTISEEENYWAPDGWDYPYAAILDTGIYNTEAAKNSALSDPGYHSLGTASSGTGKIVYKFPGFYDTYTYDDTEYLYNSSLYNLPAAQIGTAKLYFLESDGLNLSIEARPMTDTWDAETAGVNPVALYDLALFDADSDVIVCADQLNYVAGMEHREFDVTEIFKDWARYNEFERNSTNGVNPYSNPASGLVLSSENYCEITSVDNLGTSGVYVVLDTSNIAGVYNINHFTTGKFLYANEDTTEDPPIYTVAVAQSADISNFESCSWNFDYIGQNRYHVVSAKYPDYALSVFNNVVTLLNKSEVSESLYTWEMPALPSGGTALQHVLTQKRLKLSTATTVGLVDKTSTSSNLRWQCISNSNYVPLTSFEVVSNWMEVGTTKAFTIIPHAESETETPSFVSNGYFTWESSDSSIAQFGAFISQEVGSLPPYVIIARSVGTVRITVTHKLTGVKTEFDLACEVVLNDGIYAIKNKHSNNFLEVELASPNSSSQAMPMVGQKPFSSDVQLWRVYYCGSGYYNIQAVLQGGYLTPITSGTDGEMVISFASTASENGTWKLIHTSTDSYKLIYANEESSQSCLSFPFLWEDNVDHCVLRSYISDEFGNDEWQIYEVKYQATVNSYYDRGYYLGDETKKQEAIDFIQENMLVVAQRFLETIGLLIDVNSPQYYSSPLDECKGILTSETVLDQSCTCGQNDSDINVLQKAFNEEHPGNDFVTNIYWTKHFVDCTLEGQLPKYNRSRNWGNTIALLEQYDDDDDDDTVQRILMHELAHQYAASDHYHDLIEPENKDPYCYNAAHCSVCNAGTENERSQICLMYSLLWYDQRNPFCHHCMSELMAHLEDHHIYAE